MGVFFLTKLRIVWQKIDFASFGLDSRGRFSNAFLYQGGHLYDVIPLEIEKLTTANLES